METEKDAEKVESLKKEIHSISSDLKDLGSQKEEQYQQKNSLEKQLNKLISNAKELKDKKNVVDKEIVKLKLKREAANKDYKEILLQVKQEREDVKKQKRNSHVAPVNLLRKQIKELEYNIQTEVISFNKEKQIMGQIKRLKVTLNQSLDDENKFKTSKTEFKKVKELKVGADDIHEKIQKLANESSQIFKELTQLSQDIATIKAKRNTVQLVLKNLKTQMNQLNQKLSKTLKNWSGIADKFLLRTANKSRSLINKKTAEVKEKLKSKKKLTTDDILLLQREAMGK